MLKNLEHWLRRLETANGPAAGEVWITQSDDGTLRGPRGEWMTRKAFFGLHPPESPAVLTISAAGARP
jgi:hypothetical protein